jgi:uncharacterized protein YjbI with pentapeptide repeats
MRNNGLAVISIAVAIALGVISACAPTPPLPPAQVPDDEDNPPSVTLGRWVKDLKVGPKMNATGRNMRGSKFVSQDLRGAMFAGSELSDVCFHNCDLSNASFKDAVFVDTYFHTCILTDTDFDDATIHGRHSAAIGLRTTGMHLSDKQLQSTRSYRIKNLNGCTIAGGGWDRSKPHVKFDFRDAQLLNAYLMEGDFGECDFTDARIVGLSLMGARITFDQLASTLSYKWCIRKENPMPLKLSLWNGIPFAVPAPYSAIDGKVSFRGMDLTGIAIRDEPLPDADFTDTTITEGNFSGGITQAQLCVTKNYRKGNLSRIGFGNIDLSKCNLSRQNLTEARFGDCVFTGANFEDAVITDTDFICLGSGNTGLTVEQIKSTWNYKNDRMAGVLLPKELAEALEKEKELEKKATK